MTLKATCIVCPPTKWASVPIRKEVASDPGYMYAELYRDRESRGEALGRGSEGMEEEGWRKLVREETWDGSIREV